MSREAFLFTAGGRATLLQIAHPYVAQGVLNYSSLRKGSSGVMDRFNRTFLYVNSITFGTVSDARSASKMVRGLHEKVQGTFDDDVGPFISGTSYSSCHEGALLWVYATLVESTVYAIETMVRPLTNKEKESFYQDSKLFAAMFGIGNAAIPSTWKDFMEYNVAMWKSDVLTVSPAAKKISSYLFTPPSPAFAPMMKWVEMGTMMTLPRSISRQYGYQDEWMTRWIVHGTTGLLRSVYAILPGAFRYQTSYIKAMRRCDGKDPNALPLISRASATFANAILAMAMPKRHKSQ